MQQKGHADGFMDGLKELDHECVGAVWLWAKKAGEGKSEGSWLTSCMEKMFGVKGSRDRRMVCRALAVGLSDQGLAKSAVRKRSRDCRL